MIDNRHILPDCRDEEMWSLCSAMCDGTIDAQGLARLESLSESDPSNRLFCAVYMRMNGQLMRMFRPVVVAPAAAPDFAPVSTPEPDIFSPAIPQEDFHVGFLGGAWNNATGYLSSHEFFTGYLVATVLFAVAAVVGLNVYVASTAPKQYVSRLAEAPRTPRQINLHETEQERIVSIARITGMADCHWVNADDAPFHDRVVQGEKFMLKSGLLEITYHAGARVILQGPCTYEVNSTAGGYLSLGKLTARVEKKINSNRLAAAPTRRDAMESVDGDSRREGAAAKQSPPLPLSPSPPLFSVRTPTAVVTDLGTEFGVEVAANGNTESSVFQGAVVLAALDKAGNKQKGEKILHENESASVSNDGLEGGRRIVVFSREHRKLASFVRALPSPDRRAKVYFDEDFDAAPAVLKIGENVGKHFLTWGYTSGQGRTEVVLGKPSSVAALNCTVDSKSAALIQMSSGWQHAFRFSESLPLRLTFVIRSGSGGLQNSRGEPHRKWVGLQEYGRVLEQSRPMNSPGFYVTLALDRRHAIFGGERQHPGNIVFVDFTGRKTFLASWDWSRYDGDNAQTVVITLTSTKYSVKLSDSSVVNLTGSLAGDLPAKFDYSAQTIVYCQGINENAGLCMDRVRVERLSGKISDDSDSTPSSKNASPMGGKEDAMP